MPTAPYNHVQARESDTAELRRLCEAWCAGTTRARIGLEGAIASVATSAGTPAAASRCFILYTPDSSLADAIDRGEIVVASKWGVEPDWN